MDDQYLHTIKLIACGMACLIEYVGLSVKPTEWRLGCSIQLSDSQVSVQMQDLWSGRSRMFD